MTIGDTIRYLCPLACSWHYDLPPVSGAEVNAGWAAADHGSVFEKIGNVSSYITDRRLKAIDTIVRDHLTTSHTIEDWAVALREARSERDKVAAELKQADLAFEERGRIITKLERKLQRTEAERDRMAVQLEQWRPTPTCTCGGGGIIHFHADDHRPVLQESAACTHPDTWFDRHLCPEPCGAMHDRCTECSYPIGGCVIDRSIDQERPRTTADSPVSSGDAADKAEETL